MSIDTDIAYAAGVLDGDGNFGIHQSQGRLLARIQVGMTDRRVPYWFKATFGGSVCIRPAGETTEAMFSWRINAKYRIKELLPELIQHLKTKKLAAIVLLEFCERYNQKGITYNPPEELERLKYYKLMSLLNSIGPGSRERKERLLRLILPDEAKVLDKLTAAANQSLDLDEEVA